MLWHQISINKGSQSSQKIYVYEKIKSKFLYDYDKNADKV